MEKKQLTFNRDSKYLDLIETVWASCFVWVEEEQTVAKQSPALATVPRQHGQYVTCYKWLGIFLPSGRPTVVHSMLTVEIWPISPLSVSPAFPLNPKRPVQSYLI